MTKPDLSRIQRCETQLQNFLTELLDRVSPDVLSQPAGAGKWSAHDHLAHLARYHQVFLERMERMVREQTPAFARYKAEDDPAWEGWRTFSTDEVLRRLDSLRQTLIERLNTLGEHDFKKTGIHPKLGEMKLSLWLEFFLVHEGHHLYTILLQAAPAKAA